jgi:hypothetical protein
MLQFNSTGTCRYGIMWDIGALSLQHRYITRVSLWATCERATLALPLIDGLQQRVKSGGGRAACQIARRREGEPRVLIFVWPTVCPD